MHISEIPTPALLVDRSRLEANLSHMARRADELGVRLRPHIKTHKCVEIARRQVELGAEGLTVSTLFEARAFSEAGFSDLTWAFPVIPGRIEDALGLAGGGRMALLVDTFETARLLAATGREARVYLKVDCGYHRAGVDPEGPTALPLARLLAGEPTLDFEGILTHAGHSYRRRGRADLLEVARQERDVMVAFAERLRSEGIEVPVVSVGSTPTMMVVDHLEGVDEMRPGNYVFFDLSQVVYGSARVEQCALTVLASVVSSQPGTDRSIVDAAALALSKDAGPTDFGHRSMGAVYADHAAARLEPEKRLTALSQEHGHLNAALPVGSRVRILPNHSCLAAAQFDRYWVLEGDEVVDRWDVLRGRG